MQATLPTRAPFIYHRRFINDSMPDWIRHASSTDVQTLLRSQLKPHVNSNGVPHDWFTSGTPELQVSFLAAVSRQHKANRALAKALAGLKKITEYAEPLLKAKIESQHTISVDVNQAQLRSVAYARIGGYDIIKEPIHFTSLLQAALQNFEADEDFGPFSSLQHSRENEKALDLSPAQFAKLCRELDLGKGYQAHLDEIFQPPTGSPALRRKMIEANKAGFWVQLQQARLKGEISDSALTMLQQLHDQPASAVLDGQSVLCRQLWLYGCALQDVVLIGPDPVNSSRVERCIVWVPGAPLYPIKEYASSAAFLKDLHASLLDPDYRKLIVGKVTQSLRREFARQLDRHLYIDLYQGDIKVRQARPDVRLQVRSYTLGANLWSELQAQQVRQMKADARVLAVPTGDEDRNARLARLEHWLEIGSMC